MSTHAEFFENYCGCEYPEYNFFKTPNEFINLMAHIETVVELKVFIYLLRHTWGFQEFGISKKITLDEFANGRKLKDGSRMDEGTQLSISGVSKGLKLAEKHGLIEVEIDDSDGGRIKKYYKLRMVNIEHASIPRTDNQNTSECGDEHASISQMSKHVPQTCNPIPQMSKRVPQTCNRSEKETLERNQNERNQRNTLGDFCKSPEASFPDEEKTLKGGVTTKQTKKQNGVLPKKENINVSNKRNGNLPEKRNDSGFISKDEIPIKNPKPGLSSFHLKCGKRLKQILTENNCVCQNKTRTALAEGFRLLERADKVPPEEIKQVLIWYRKNFSKRFVKKSYSSQKFRENWNNLKRAMENDGWEKSETRSKEKRNGFGKLLERMTNG